MAKSRTFRLRVTYEKAGRLAMLSHLELTHALERTVRRSGLPFALTQGFSPHMKLAYGSALPVGIGSTCEIFDLTLTRYVAPAKALAALAGACAPSCRCIACEYVEPSAKAASVAYPCSTYEAIFSEVVDSVSCPREVRVIRKKKEKVLQVADFLEGEMELDGCAVRFQLRSGDGGSLRPDVLLRAACVRGESGAEMSPCRVTRISQSEHPIRSM